MYSFIFNISRYERNMNDYNLTKHMSIRLLYVFVCINGYIANNPGIIIQLTNQKLQYLLSINCFYHI